MILRLPSGAIHKQRLTRVDDIYGCPLTIFTCYIKRQNMPYNTSFQNLKQMKQSKAIEQSVKYVNARVLLGNVVLQ